jgi:hypothetical protein
MRNTSAEFPLPLCVEFLDGHRWKLTAPFEYHSAKYGLRRIEAGLVFDFGSIPSALHGFISPTKSGRAFLVHDDAYEKGDLEREQADDLLREAMAAETRLHDQMRLAAKQARSGFIPDKGMGAIRRFLVWRAVHRAGFVAWNQHRERDGDLKYKGVSFTLPLALALACLATGCKITTASHAWPDGSRTEVFDGRLLHKQEAAFTFHRAASGAVTVRGTVSSVPDAESVKAAAQGAAKGAVEGLKSF